MSVHEPGSKDTKADIGSNDSSGDCVIGKSIITYRNSKIVSLATMGKQNAMSGKCNKGTSFGREVHRFKKVWAFLPTKRMMITLLISFIWK